MAEETFTVKNVNCDFLLPGAGGLENSILGDRRLYKFSQAIAQGQRGFTYKKDHALTNPVPGIVVAAYTTSQPRMTTPVDFARYKASVKPDFEVFSYVYKVWTPCVKAELLPEDFDPKNKKVFEKKVAVMQDVVVSLSANPVMGAIPPGTYVEVEFADINHLTNPRIVRIGEKIFDLSSIAKAPSGNEFKLASYGGPSALGKRGSGKPRRGGMKDKKYPGSVEAALLRPDGRKWNPQQVGAGSYTYSQTAVYWRNRGKKNGQLTVSEMVKIPGHGGYRLHEVALRAFMAMEAQAKADGVPVTPDSRVKKDQIWRISSGYRNRSKQQGLANKNTDGAAKVGNSPHGWGGAVDFGNLYRAALRARQGQSGGKAAGWNQAGSKTNAKAACADLNIDSGSWNDLPTADAQQYRWLIMNGPKFGWYNPWRLAEGSRMEEIWHFEYWGPVPGADPVNSFIASGITGA